MKNVMRKMVCLTLAAAMLWGCGKTGENVEKATESNKQTEVTKQVEQNKKNLVVPEFKETILTDLENCDITYMKNMGFSSFDFRLISTKELDKKKLDIKFDTSLGYKWNVADSETDDGKKFGYKLFCAYNDDNKEATEDDYNQLITNNENFPKLYTYEIVVKINLNSAKKDTDNDISEMTVTYEGKEYKFKVGKICVDREAMQNTFAVDLAGKDTAVQTTGNISGITMGETFDMYLDGLVETSSKGVEIQDVYLKNVDNSIKLNNVEITIKNSDGDSNIKFDKSKKNEIPSKSTADFSLNCSNILLKKSVGGRAFPILCIDYKTGDTSGTMNVPIDAVVTPKTSYEIYAYKIDGVNIFD